jgi:hypothetical protein
MSVCLSVNWRQSRDSQRFIQIFSSSFLSAGAPWRWPTLVEACGRQTNMCAYRNVCCGGWYKATVHIACSNKTSRVSKHHFLHFPSKAWRCASTCHACLVTQRSDTGRFCMKALRQMKWALRLPYGWTNGWSMGCGAARAYSGSSSCDVTCLHVCTVCVCVCVCVYTTDQYICTTRMILYHLREIPVSVLCIIPQSVLQKAKRATSCWLCFDVCH